MEQNIPIVAKKVWSIVRVVFFMLRKGLSKRKLLVDLNMMLKRGKIAGKAALVNLIHHHHSHHVGSSGDGAPKEYEFSCSNTPAYTFPFHLTKKSKHHHNHFFACAHAPQTLDDDVVTVNAVKAVLEMLNNNNDHMPVEASPALPGFGRSPFVRPLRITDSPFPIREADDNGIVDKKAEEFIQKFYRELKKQKIMDE